MSEKPYKVPLLYPGCLLYFSPLQEKAKAMLLF